MPRGWWGAVPGGGVACICCEGRLVSGAVPPSAARPLERAARVPRPVCPGCGRCGRGDPAPAPQRAPLRAGVARCGGGGKGVPGGGAFHHCEGRLRSGAVPPLTARPLGGLLGSATHVLWARVCGCWGPNPVPWACMPCGGGVPRGWWGAFPRGGRPATVVRGVWCQALSLPRPPVLWSGQPGVRYPCLLVAVGAGVGTQHRPHSVRPCGPALLAVGVAEGRPRGGAFHRCEGRLRSCAVPPPTALPLGGMLGSATHGLRARVCGCGGPTLSPWPACPVGAACRWGGGGPSPGGWPATVVRGVWCQALSLPRPPVLWSGQPGLRDPRVPAAVGVGVGTQPRPRSVRPCGPALLTVGVAEGRPRGGVPSAVVRGVCGQALPLPRLPALWACCWGPSPTCRGRGCVGVGAQHCPLGLHALWGLRAAGVVGGRPRGGVACHRCEGRLVSGAVPPLAARPLGRAARVPRPVCPGCGWCGRGVPALAPRRAPLRAGIARRGGGGRASPGGVPFAVVRGVWGQALPLSRLPALWAGCRGPLPTCCGRGCAGVGALHRPRGPRALWGAARHGGGGGRLGSGAPSSLLPALWAGCRGPLAACRGCGSGCVRCVWCLCGARRGAGCCPSPVPLVLCCGVALPVCLPCPLPCARPLLVCCLPPVSFVASSFFTLSSPLCWLALESAALGR